MSSELMGSLIGVGASIVIAGVVFSLGGVKGTSFIGVGGALMLPDVFEVV